MKKAGLFIFLYLLGQVFLPSTSQTLAGTDEQSAKIVFYRIKSYYASSLKMTILANDQAIVRLKNGSYYEFITDPGTYYFSSSMASETRIKLDVEPGKTYYIKCYIKQGFWSGEPQLELVDTMVGKSVIDGGTISMQTFEPINTAPRKSRAGLSFGAGGGFETIDLFIDENGDDITLSTGGGLMVGAKYGYALSKYFDVSVDWFYQSSSLSRPLKNAKATFNRMGVIVTPAIVIPIKGGDYFRFRLGGGAGLYSLGSMYIDASDIPGGEELKFKYKPAIGGHANFEFEFNFSENASMSMGLKYYQINYTYKSKGSSHSSPEKLFNEPNGSGIDFMIGYQYRF